MSDPSQARILRHVAAVSFVVQRRKEQNATAIRNHVHSIENAVDHARAQARGTVEDHLKGAKLLVDAIPLDYFAPLRGRFYERAHTMMLGFFLDRRYTGAFAEKLLKCILFQVLSRGDCREFDRTLFREALAQMEGGSLSPSPPIIEGGLGNRVNESLPDIKIMLKGTGPSRFVIIENKVFALEGRDQTPKYVRGNNKTIRKTDCRNCVRAQNNRSGNTHKKQSRDPLCNNAIPSNLDIYIYLDLKAQLPSCARFALCDYEMLAAALKQAEDSLAQSPVSSRVKMLVSAYSQSVQNLCKRHEFTLEDLTLQTPEDFERLSLKKLLYLQQRIELLKKESHDSAQN